MNNLKSNLLTLLSENAKYSTFELASMLSVDEKEIVSTIEELEKEGIIVKYTTIINTECLQEKSVQALIEVKVAPQKLKGFDTCAEEIYNFPEVKSLYLMSGGFDLAVFVEGKDITEIARFVAEKLSVVDGIIGVATHFILKKYKIEGHITKPSEEIKRQIIGA